VAPAYITNHAQVLLALRRSVSDSPAREERKREEVALSLDKKPLALAESGVRRRMLIGRGGNNENRARDGRGA